MAESFLKNVLNESVETKILKKKITKSTISDIKFTQLK